MVTGLGHLALRARDGEALTAFYRDVVGLPEAFRLPGAVYLHAGPGSFLEIFYASAPAPEAAPREAAGPSPEGAAPLGFDHLCLEVDDAAAFLEEYRRRGGPVEGALKRGQSRCLQFWSRDPEGNRIEFMELPPESLQAQAVTRFSSPAPRA